MTKRIGILGGSFDPIHNGHLIIGTDACEQFDLDHVLFVPAYQAPLKSKKPSASAQDRMIMAKLATEGEDRFICSDVDYRSETTSYSVVTARALVAEYPGSQLFWILGADQITQLHHWRDIDVLGRLVSFIAFERPGSKIEINPSLPDHVSILAGQGRQLEISSTEIRDRLKRGLSAKYFLPEKVFAHIKAENLYL